MYELSSPNHFFLPRVWCPRIAVPLSNDAFLTSSCRFSTSSPDTSLNSWKRFESFIPEFSRTAQPKKKDVRYSSQLQRKRALSVCVCCCLFCFFAKTSCSHFLRYLRPWSCTTNQCHFLSCPSIYFFFSFWNQPTNLVELIACLLFFIWTAKWRTASAVGTRLNNHCSQ